MSSLYVGGFSGDAGTVTPARNAHPPQGESTSLGRCPNYRRSDGKSPIANVSADANVRLHPRRAPAILDMKLAFPVRVLGCGVGPGDDFCHVLGVVMDEPPSCRRGSHPIPERAERGLAHLRALPQNPSTELTANLPRAAAPTAVDHGTARHGCGRLRGLKTSTRLGRCPAMYFRRGWCCRPLEHPFAPSLPERQAFACFLSLRRPLPCSPQLLTDIPCPAGPVIGVSPAAVALPNGGQ